MDIINISKSNNKINSNIKDQDISDKLNTKSLENYNNINLKEKDRERDQNEREKTFFNYILYKITCGKKKQFFNTYQKFRIKIISEEHLIRNHLNIYNLMKVTERKRHNRRNSYQFKDLINLV